MELGSAGDRQQLLGLSLGNLDQGRLETHDRSLNDGVPVFFLAANVEKCSLTRR